MWALGESLETLTPDVKVYFKSKVASVNCWKTELTVEGEAAGTYQFDLIIGADGVGSQVRKAMVEAFPEVTASRVTGEEYVYTIYMDNHEVIGKNDPSKAYMS